MSAKLVGRHIAVSLDDVRTEFESRMSLYEALEEEARFIVVRAIDQSGIKIHVVESRIKNYESFSKKYQSGEYKSIDVVHDIVGLRIVCLFKSDIDNLTALVASCFEIISVDNKIEDSEDTFGYMSVHCIVKMKQSYRGPRYDAVRGIVFEVQIRTLCMHAWAAISHYLDYKAEWDIPGPLKKGLNALSGLFYVADAQYEYLYNSRQKARETVSTAPDSEAHSQPINFDTVQAMLRRQFPNREEYGSAGISHLVKELVNNGFENIGEVENAITSVSGALAAKEDERRREKGGVAGEPVYWDLAAARLSLRLNSKSYIMTDIAGDLDTEHRHAP